MSLALRQSGLVRDLVLPEAALVGGVAVFGAAHLLDLAVALSPGGDGPALQRARPATVSLAPDVAPDLRDIKGQAGPKQALEIAAAGALSLLLIGPPSTGKSMLAQHGVLFLDELPEYPRAVLEALRELMENGHILIARAARHAEFPARFQLVAAMNPCPCGQLGNLLGECPCSPDQVSRYVSVSKVNELCSQLVNHLLQSCRVFPTAFGATDSPAFGC